MHSQPRHLRIFTFDRNIFRMKRCSFAVAYHKRAASKVMEEEVGHGRRIIESLTHAKTPSCELSSSSGMQTEIFFEPESHQIIGSRLTNYFIELDRVTRSPGSEQSYPIFRYYLAAGGEADSLKQSHPGLCAADLEAIGSSRQRFLASLSAMGFTEAEIAVIWKITGIVARLAEKSPSTEADQLKEIWSELKCSPDAAVQGLSVPVADLAKHLYKGMVDWVLHKINQRLGQKIPPMELHSSIRILEQPPLMDSDSADGFEKVCSNYANEKLYQIYIANAFRSVSAEINSELALNGVPDILSVDNSELLTLFESPGGICDLLHQSLHSNISSIGQHWAQSLKAHFSSNKHLVFPPNQGSSGDTATQKLVQSHSASAAHFIINHTEKWISYKIGEDRSESLKPACPLHKLLRESQDPAIEQVFQQLYADGSASKEALAQTFRFVKEQAESVPADATSFVLCVKVRHRSEHFVRLLAPPICAVSDLCFTCLALWF